MLSSPHTERRQCHCSDHECIYLHVPFTVITQHGETALMRAASKGHTEVVVELVKAKANLDLQNNVSTCYYDCTCSHVTI